MLFVRVSNTIPLKILLISVQVNLKLSFEILRSQFAAMFEADILFLIYENIVSFGVKEFV